MEYWQVMGGLATFRVASGAVFLVIFDIVISIIYLVLFFHWSYENFPLVSFRFLGLVQRMENQQIIWW